VVALTAVTLPACQKKSPEEDLLKKVEPVGSWLASLEMTGRKWLANSVPTSFAKNSLSAAGKAFDKAAEETAKSEAGPEVRARLGQLVSEARAAGAGLRRGIEAGDRGAVAREVGRLAQLHRRFDAIEGGGGS
jgi:hypothetical protein